MRRPRGLFQRRDRAGWFAWVRVENALKQRRMGTTLKEAKRNRDRIERAGGDRPIVTVAQAVGVWSEKHLTITRRSERDRKIVRGRVDRYLTKFLGFDRVSSLTYSRLSEYRLWLDTLGLAPQTVFHIMGDLRSLLLFLVRSGGLDRTPFDRILMPKVAQRLARPLLPEEVVAVCKIPGELGFQCRLGIETGFRFSDLCELDRKNFDGTAFILVAQKTGRAVRVPVDLWFAAEVRVRIGRLFPRAPGSSGSFARSVREQSGVVGFSAHRMRHTFANRMRAKGLDVYRIRDLLGHRTVLTTELYLSSLAAYDPDVVPTVSGSVSLT